MKMLLKPAVTAGLILMAASPMAAAPAAAQALQTVGVVDLQYILGQTKAYKTAETQRAVTYKQYLDQAKTRKDAIEKQIQPLVDKLQADSKLPNANREALQKQADTIQQLDQNGQRELQQILAPVLLSQEYVQEQINDVLPKAIENAAKTKGVTLMFDRGSTVVYRAKEYDMNQTVIDAVDALLPVAQLVPPPGWLPRRLREQQEAQQGAQAPAQPQAAAPAAPSTAAGPPAEGR